MASLLDFNKNTSGPVLTDKVKNLSKFGLVFNDEVLKQSMAIGPTEAMFMKQGFVDDYFKMLLSAADIGDKKAIAIFDQEYVARREFLRKFAMNGEIEWIIDTVSDEAIVYDEKNFFATPIHSLKGLMKSEEKLKEIEDALYLNFNRIYHFFNFNQSILGWQLFKQFLIDGFLAFEIIYNKENTKIIAFKQIDATELEPGNEKTKDGVKKTWTQYPKDPGQMKRTLYDSQVIYISYSHSNYMSRVSYVERLVRTHNLLRMMEHTRTIWNLMNATFRLKMIVPIGELSSARAEQTLSSLMSRFKEDIDFNNESGELKINGKPSMQFFKNYMVPSKSGEEPTIETLSGEGPELKDTDIIDYFYHKLKVESKIPLSRFDNDGSSTFYLSADGIDREEIKFFKFILRLRSVYQEILLKPLLIQMQLDFPELQDDDLFKMNIGLKFNKDNIFEELKEMEIIDKRMNYISALKDLKDDLDEKPIFSMKWLIKKLGFTSEELEENRRLLNDAFSESESEEE